MARLARSVLVSKTYGAREQIAQVVARAPEPTSEQLAVIAAVVQRRVRSDTPKRSQGERRAPRHWFVSVNQLIRSTTVQKRTKAQDFNIPDEDHVSEGDYIAQVIADSPKPTGEQVAFIAALLRGAMRTVLLAESTRMATAGLAPAALAPLEEVRVYPLTQVAAITNIAHRSIELYCRTGKLEHVKNGRSRGMTIAQMRKLVDAHTEGTTKASEMTEMELAIEHSRRNVRASRSRRP